MSTLPKKMGWQKPALLAKKIEADRLTIRLLFVELELLLLGSSLIYSSGQARLVTRGGVAMQHALLHGLIDF